MSTLTTTTKYLLVIVLAVFAYSNADYVAAVVEHHPLTGATPNETLLLNYNEYIYHIRRASDNKVQIIVFPEYGLTAGNPVRLSIEIPNVGFGPIYQHEVLQGLSDAAAEHSMYIVVNIGEKAHDENNKTIYYNTNVVFDKDRKIAAKYRKINLFGELFFTPGKPEENSHVVFTTDFGVSFGVFTCFDILFYTPSRTVLNSTEKVTNVIFPTAWMSQLPFYHSLSFHYAYAMENKVNILVANLNNVKIGGGGSGIFGGDGTIYTYYMPGRDGSKLLIGNVKTGSIQNAIPDFNTDLNLIVDPDDDLDNYKTSRMFESSKYSMRQIDISQPINSTKIICDGVYCCKFSYNISSPNNSSVYYIMAYDGQSSLGAGVTAHVKMCYLIACETVDRSTCGTRNVKQTVRFDQIEVSSEVADIPGTYNVPYSLTTGLLPIFNTTHSQSIQNGKRYISLTTRKSEEEVLVFGIYGSVSTTSTRSGAMLKLFDVYKQQKYKQKRT